MLARLLHWQQATRSKRLSSNQCFGSVPEGAFCWEQQHSLDLA